ncbi:hypothetical protein B484DRAFT_451005 [Ochromonadaceae sp. CCMP2298]|nr:hypothetical protein B484DRAFT_451005 [Ochromonadaceae sp. CCMP2298]|mmetsp:Transcript_16758/g.37189  ORF Transcript_16758/g.37189 Transcript_16758/m.37189 type:complete len:555 (-) Transcript_16758:100-1764(-)
MATKDLAQTIEDIVDAPNDRTTKLALLDPIVSGPFGGDFGRFLLSLEALSDAKACKVLKLLLKYDTSLCQSEALVEVVAMLTRRACDDLSQLFLEYVQPGIFTAGTAEPREKVDVLVSFAISCIPAKSLSLSEQAWHITSDAITTLGLTELVDVLNAQSKAYSQDAVLHLRFVSLLSRVCAYSDEVFRRCEEVGAVADIVTLCTTDDILVQINALELLADLAKTVRGLEYLCSNAVVYWLVATSCGSWVGPGTESPGTGTALVPGVRAREPDPLLGAQALRVLGTVFSRASDLRFDLLARLDPSCVRHFLLATARCCEEGSEEMRVTGLAVLADFAIISLATLQLVLGEGAAAEPPLLGAWMGLLNCSKSELVAAVLHSVASILYKDDAQYLASAGLTVFTSAAESKGPAPSDVALVATLKRQLLAAVGTAKRTDTVTLLLRLATQPIEASRCAAVNLLTAVAAQPSGWGLQMLFQHTNALSNALHANFHLYLQERCTEYCKEGKDWKFGLIVAVSKNPARCHLPAELNEKVDLMVRQGAYYMPPRADVQMAEN